MEFPVKFPGGSLTLRYDKNLKLEPLIVDIELRS